LIAALIGVTIFVALYRWLHLETVIDMIMNPSDSIPDVNINK